jgi:N utilization substance protein B
MITRRNIRIKVMQLLYSIETTNDTTAFKNPVNTLKNNFEKSRELFTFLIANTIAVAQYSEKDSRIKAAKHIPTEYDLNVNTKIAGNEILWKILEMPSYQNAVDIFKTNLLIDESIIKKIYEALVETNEYKLYINTNSRDRKDDVFILKFIFNDLLLQSDVFVSYTEEKFGNIDDDAEMIQSLINAFLGRPQQIDSTEWIDDDKWIFGRNLLNTCLEKSTFLLDTASPKFKNWDADRIATLDIIIIKMGLSELLYFETIPTKVTINEYIDLAKEYSTVQSGQFINGILDNLNKELLSQGKINKVDFRKKN